MIRRKEEIQVRKVSNAQGGEGDVTFFDWLLPDEAPGHGRVFSKLVIPPGCSLGYHKHEGEFEAYYVLSGEATVNDNGKEEILRAGDMNLCHTGESHSTANKGTEDLVLLVLIMKDLAG